MYNCPSCKETISTTSNDPVDDVRIHLNQHKKFGKLVFPVSCVKESCTSNFIDLKNLYKHIRKYHAVDPAPAVEDELMQFNGADGLDDCVDMQENCAKQKQDFNLEQFMVELENDLKNNLFEMMLEIRAKASVTFTTTLLIINIISSVINFLLDKILYAVGQCLSADPFETRNKLVQLETAFGRLKTCTTVFDSEFKIRKYYESHPLFVQPKEIVISQRYYKKLNYSLVVS